LALSVTAVSLWHIVAVVKATQALVTYLRNEAEAEGNSVIDQGISEWAYIQCVDVCSTGGGFLRPPAEPRLP
jgi:hypothetical protein